MIDEQRQPGLMQTQKKPPKKMDDQFGSKKMQWPRRRRGLKSEIAKKPRCEARGRAACVVLIDFVEKRMTKKTSALARTSLTVKSVIDGNALAVRRGGEAFAK